MSEVDKVIFEQSWTDEDADALHKKVFNYDPLRETRNVPPSLLSATDIVEYVKKTAMISPFRATNRTLKHASYEACIGANAYIYGKLSLKRIKLTEDGYLRVPANEIVFVESDVTFRLPRYIAARFNLQIAHVHRGMLLGTGPLVDPGFRGRLLIPLHNLTSEDHYIHKNDGFIWIEFTRTTYNEDRDAESPFGEYPEYKQLSDGTKWLHKAAFSKHLNQEVPIRSSILPIVNRVEKQANKAIKVARGLQRTAFVGALALLVTFTLIMLGEIYTNRTFMQSIYSSMSDQSGLSQSVVDGIYNNTAKSIGDVELLKKAIDIDIQRMNQKIDELNKEVLRLVSGQAQEPARLGDRPAIAE